MTLLNKALTLLLALIFLSAALCACGSSGQPADTEEPGEDTVTEPEDTTAISDETSDEPGREETTGEGDAYEYIPPEDGSFTVCGFDLSDYSLLIGPYAYSKKLQDELMSSLESSTGTKYYPMVTTSTVYDTEPKKEHEILFGMNYQRNGMPEADYTKNCYGATADGTIYFRCPDAEVYGYVWRLFLEEFLGVVPGSGEKSAGCAINEFYRELPSFDTNMLAELGYTMVFKDDFEEDELDMDVWRNRGSGTSRNGYTAASQVSVRDGNLILRGEYLADGEYGEGWYSASVALRKWYCRGYFEAYLKCSPYTVDGDFSSAFWIQGPNPYTAEQSRGGAGPGGAELDIMEIFDINDFHFGIWLTGVDGSTELSHEGGVHQTADRVYEDYHKIALLWDEDKYMFFFDGLLVNCTDFAYGTSGVEEEVIFSLGIAEETELTEDTVREMFVDYIQIWQKQ